MRECIQTVTSELDRLPKGSEFAVLLAGDNVQTLVPLQSVNPDACARAIQALRTARFDGGMDNVPALVSAWELAAERPSSAILWIHGPQPSMFTSIDALTQRWERRPDGPRLFSLEAIPGDNAPLRALDWTPRPQRSTPRHADGRHDTPACRLERYAATAHSAGTGGRRALA